MLTDPLLLLGGLAVIIKGGDLFVTAAVRLAACFRLPRVVIGSTLVSLATTLPELVVSLTAGWRGEAGLALGNAVGSVICNLALILGVTAVLKPVQVNLPSLRLPLLTGLAASFLLLLLTEERILERWHGGILLALGTSYFGLDFWRHWRDRQPAEVSEAKAIEAGIVRTRFPWLETKAGSLSQFLLGAVVVILGSRLIVDGAVGVAARLGIPSLVIGLTVVAVGTSLPELVTAVTSARRSVSDLAVGNVLGANVANLTLILGLAALIQPVALDRASQLFSFPVMIALMLLLLGMLWQGQGLTRRHGRWLLTIYAAYLATVGLFHLHN
jgi:cation:H+ antiporter